MQLEKRIAWPLPVSELECALHVVRSFTRADMSVLLLNDEPAGEVIPVIAHGLTAAQLQQIGHHRPGGDPFGQALMRRQRVVVRDAWHREKELARLAQSLGFRSIEIIPLVGVDEHVVGEIALMFRRSRGSSRRALRMVERCARLVVLTVQHARRAVEAERARELAETTGRAKVQFVARMSHELRTPLQSIIGYIDLMRLGDGDALSPNQARILSRMQRGGQLLARVVDDLITYSRLEAGKVAYDIVPVVADDVISAAQDVVAPLAADHRVRIEPQPSPGIFVAADPEKVKQILVNLAANAVKFSRGGTVRLACRVTRGGSTASFEVADDGPGIEAEQLQRIFEPYVQLNTPVVDRYGGAGLGLAISREFAAGMHGRLFVRSAVGKGSTFCLELPRVGPDGSAVVTARRATRDDQPRSA
jgi:signal transduction histidine kinase